MSRSKPNLGEPYQIYSEVLNVGKTVEGSKKRVRWLFGFTEKEREVEVALIHSVTSGKKTIFENGKEIVTSTNRLATDFGHTWRSESCQGRLFRVEFVTSFTTEPTVYTFTVDGVKYVDMPKKGNIGNGGRDSGNYAKNRSINGFGSSGAADSGASAGYSNTSASHSHTAPASNRSSGFGQQSHTAQPAPSHAATTTTSRRFIYDDDEEDESSAASAAKTATPAAAPRANFQSPFAPTNTATNAANANVNSGFGFDPFDESPAPAPAAKPSPAASLFDAFEETPPPAKAATKKPSGSSFNAFGDDPFGSSSDPFSSPAPAAAPQRTPASQPVKVTAPAPKAPSPAFTAAPAAPAASKPLPNFFDDDFAPAAPSAAPPAAPAADDFGNFGTTNAAPQRRSSAIEISNDFAGLTFAPAPAPAPVMSMAAPSPAPAVRAPTPTDALATKDPWSQSSLVNLDLSGGSAPPKRPSGTAQGPSLGSMMHVPTNTRASFTAGSPSATMPMNTGAGAQMGGSMAMGLPQGQNTRGSFNAGSNNTSNSNIMGGMPAQQGYGNQQSFGTNNLNNTRGSFTAPQGVNMGGFGGMNAPAGGNMGNNNMGNMGNMGGMNMNSNNNNANRSAYGNAQQMPTQKSSLDDLEWKF